MVNTIYNNFGYDFPCFSLYLPKLLVHHKIFISFSPGATETIVLDMSKLVWSLSTSVKEQDPLASEVVFLSVSVTLLYMQFPVKRFFFIVTNVFFCQGALVLC